MVRANGTQQRVPFCIGGVLDRRSPGKLALATRLARRDNLANQLIKTLVHVPEKSLPRTWCGWAPRFRKDHAQTIGWSAHEIRHFLRAPASAAVERGRRAQAVSGGARSGRARRQARHRLRLGSRAPFSGGIFALLCP